MTSDSDTIETPDDLRALAAEARAWPFEEARKVMARIGRAKTPPEEIVFETGYGPSGLPHIGTFGEVSRTSMVRHAFAQMSDIKTRIVCFSDDMDGLRKVPDNIPNQEMVSEHLGKPLTRVPDPFGTHDSFGAHNNARLQSFLDQFGFDYEFVSATECYTAGRFDAMLLTMLERHQKVLDIMLPTLGEERRKTYSPFLPVCPRTGQVLLAAVEETDPKAGTIVYRDPETDALVEVPVTGGACKLQWKADWAMRWAALGVDYEMSGKDLIDSVKASSQICRVLGAEPPDGFSYELFLDENGEKISKSRGNGLTIEEWLAYASPESLQLFMYQGPRKAKRLYFDVIPRNVDDYLTFLEKYPDQSAADRLSNPAWHIHGGEPPARDVPISFNVLLNLVSASNAEDKDVLWGFIGRYAPDASPEKNPGLDQLAGYAVRYFHDFVKPTKTFRLADDKERAALGALSEALAKLPADADAEAIQFEVYEIGKAHGFEPLRDWFKALYEVLLGQSQGPRFGSFAALYGLEETRALIAKGLTGELAG